MERYRTLWTELTGSEDFTTDEMWRIQMRIERLNELGFDVDELDIVTDWDGATARIQPKVVEAGHHNRRLQSPHRARRGGEPSTQTAQRPRRLCGGA